MNSWDSRNACVPFVPHNVLRFLRFWVYLLHMFGIFQKVFVLCLGNSQTVSHIQYWGLGGRGGTSLSDIQGGKEGGGEGEKSRAKSTLDLLSPPAKSFGYFQRHSLITQCRGKHFEEWHFITIHENTSGSHSCPSWSKLVFSFWGNWARGKERCPTFQSKVYNFFQS